MSWNAGRILLALAKHFRWRENHLFTEFEIDGGRADLVILTRARYLTEIEIKISLSDWNADQHKSKFKHPRPHVSRFFYAIPETLENSIPDWIPPTAGIIVVRHGQWPRHDSCKEIRTATRVAAQSVPLKKVETMYRNYYYRYWYQEIQRIQTNVMDRQHLKTLARGMD